jgi:hypothetical protein
MTPMGESPCAIPFSFSGARQKRVLRRKLE